MSVNDYPMAHCVIIDYFNKFSENCMVLPLIFTKTMSWKRQHMTSKINVKDQMKQSRYPAAFFFSFYSITNLGDNILTFYFVIHFPWYSNIYF
jgi:hypothetical protein